MRHQAQEHRDQDFVAYLLSFLIEAVDRLA